MLGSLRHTSRRQELNGTRRKIVNILEILAVRPGVDGCVELEGHLVGTAGEMHRQRTIPADIDPAGETLGQSEVEQVSGTCVQPSWTDSESLPHVLDRLHKKSRQRLSLSVRPGFHDRDHVQVSSRPGDQSEEEKPNSARSHPFLAQTARGERFA